MVDPELLAMFRSTMTGREYLAEVEAQWVDEAGSYFTAEELSQLSNLEFEAMDSGSLRIAVPDRRGDDDLAMALSLAVSPQVAEALRLQSSRYAVGRYPRGGGRIVWDGEDDELERRTTKMLAALEARGSRSLTGQPVSRGYAEGMARVALGRPRRRRPLEGTR
jgi:hypothetical protein